jgi:transcriptional regulator with XRE-family HTH domain
MGSGRLRLMRAVYLTRDAARRQVLAHFLRKRRAELGLTRLQLADRAGLSWGALAEYERSCQQTPSAVTLRALAGKELHLLDEFGFARCTVYESEVGSLMAIRYDRILRVRGCNRTIRPKVRRLEQFRAQANDPSHLSTNPVIKLTASSRGIGCLGGSCFNAP